MTDWLKEHRFSLIVGTAFVILFSYNYLANFFLEEEVSIEEEWMLPEESGEESTITEVIEDPAVPIIVMADIKGAVVNPGVYEIFEGERIIDLIEKAGGLKDEADSSVVNFALKVNDEMAVYIPKKGEAAPINGGEVISGSGTNTSETSLKVNLNSALAAELETLPGIGPAKATAIIEFRETKGPFKSIEDLKLISGIGGKTFDKLKDSITVK